MIDKELADFAGGVAADYAQASPLSAEEGVAVLVAIRDCRADLADLAKRIEADLLEDVPFGEKQIANAEVKRSKNRRWDHPQVVRHLIARALDERVMDPETGEMREPSHETVARVLIACAGIGYWRVTELAKHGLDADEFSEGEWRTTIQLPKR